jgi:hypothetical protein
MDIKRSIDEVAEILASHPDPKRPDKAILSLLDIALRFNDFEFACQFFLQVLDTAMGKRFAPNLVPKAAVVSDFIIRPQHYFRFIDDTFFIWCGSLHELKEFEVFLNNLIPGIKVTLVIRSQAAEFLDILIYKQWMVNQTVLKTRFFFKPTDTHQLLHSRSFHPKHTCRVLKSQFIRFKRICSSFREYYLACFTLYKVLRERGNSLSLFRRLRREVWLSNVNL